MKWRKYFRDAVIRSAIIQNMNRKKGYNSFLRFFLFIRVRDAGLEPATFPV